MVWIAAGCIHLLFWVSLRSGWLWPFFTDTAHLYGPGCDFFALYQAGHAALEGKSLYTSVPGQTVVPYAYPFRYLPVAAYFPGGLFTLAPPTVSYALWLGINELCLLHNARLTWRRSGGGSRGAWLCAVWLTFTPLFAHMWQGQFTLLLGSMLFWSVLALEDGQWRRAQAWWIASVLWKPAAVFWLPLWVRDRRFWPGVGLTGALLLANGLYFWCFPRDYALFSLMNLEIASLFVASNIGLSALIHDLTRSGALYAVARQVVTGILLVPALWVTFYPLFRSARQPNRPGQAAETPSDAGAPPVWLLAALWTALFFLVYKEVWEQHLVMLLPFLVLGLWRAPSRLQTALVVLLALPSPFVFYDVPGLAPGVDPQPYFSRAVSLVHHSWRVVPLLVLYGHWLWLAWRCDGARSTL